MIYRNTSLCVPEKYYYSRPAWCVETFEVIAFSLGDADLVMQNDDLVSKFSTGMGDILTPEEESPALDNAEPLTEVELQFSVPDMIFNP